MKRGPKVLLLVTTATLVAAGVVVFRRPGIVGEPARYLPGNRTAAARAPSGVRIKVEVANATRTRGLARRATRVLRDLGYDVVDIGTAPEQRDSTLVLDRSGHPEWARLVAAALGGARVESRPDSSRYLDVTVLLGGAWVAPPDPFDP